jgi:hypothetical protein
MRRERRRSGNGTLDRRNNMAVQLRTARQIILPPPDDTRDLD